MSFKIDWSSLIVDIVKKKDLDCYEFKDCWEEEYDWTDLDKFVIENFRELLLEYGKIEAERMGFKGNLKKDLVKYEKEIKGYDELQEIVAEKLEKIKNEKNTYK